jgi:hypothetical protein
MIIQLELRADVGILELVKLRILHHDERGSIDLSKMQLTRLNAFDFRCLFPTQWPPTIVTGYAKSGDSDRILSGFLQLEGREITKGHMQ